MKITPTLYGYNVVHDGMLPWSPPHFISNDDVKLAALFVEECRHDDIRLARMFKNELGLTCALAVAKTAIRLHDTNSAL